MTGMKRFYFFIVINLAFCCTNIEDASPEERNTFMRFYEKGSNYTGQTAEIIKNGYVIAGNTTSGTIYNAIISITDVNGNVLYETVLENASVSSIKKVSDGYLIWGDSIQIDPAANNVNDQIVTRAHLIKMDSVLKNRMAHTFIYSPKDAKVDFHGSSITLDQDEKNIISVGSFKSGSNPGKVFVAAYNPATLDTLWTQFYGLQDRDYINSKSVFVNQSGEIVWASSALNEQQSASRSYLAVPFVEPNSTFVNSGLFGENEDLFYSGEDIQPSSVGYGVTGTFSNIQKQNQNIYFVRFDISGNVIEGSERYFDAIGQEGKISVASTISQTEDIGSALSPTSDGGFLLGGSLTSTPDIGNGGKDIFLIRIDAFGNVLWNKHIGGIGDETVSSIRTTSDGGFLICGSSSVNGLSSVLIIKTDKNGDIKN